MPAQAAPGSASVAVETGDARPSELVVIYRGGVSERAQREVIRDERATLLDDLEPADDDAAHDMDLVRVRGDLDRTITRLERSDEVLVAEPNYIYEFSALPNDPFFTGQLWGLDNTGQAVNGIPGTADADIDAPEAWQLSTGSNQVVVAVVDSGVDYRHEDLKENIWTNLGEQPDNGRDDDGNGFIDDVHGYDFAAGDADPSDGHSHGTHVAGTIGAVGNNGIGVTGVSWSVRLLPVRVLNEKGQGTLANIVAGFAYASANGAQIINASLGGPNPSKAMQDVIEGTKDKTLYVVAAGNDAKNVDESIDYPCGYRTESMLCVAATDSNDRLAVFSNFGEKTVDIAAPGTNIYSTVPGNKYGYKSGTSMAAPHVAGAAAVIHAFQAGLTPQQVRKLILTSVSEDLPSLGGFVDGRRRLGLPKQQPPKVEAPNPKKPEPARPTPTPNVPVDRPDLPAPTDPAAPEPELDYYTPVVGIPTVGGGSGGVVLVIGPFTQLPTLTDLNATFGGVNRSYVKQFIVSLRQTAGTTCWYLTADARYPWLEHSCGDELYLELNTDATGGELSYGLSPAQRAGLCKGNYTLTTRLTTTTDESLVIDKRKLAVTKNGSAKRCAKTVTKKRKKKAAK